MPSKSYPRGILRAAPAFYVPLTLASILMPPKQNSKSEARNPKQFQMSQIENSKRASLQAVRFRDLEIRILNLFRISKFEFRISKGKLNNFVNFIVTKKSLIRYWRIATPPIS